MFIQTQLAEYAQNYPFVEFCVSAEYQSKPMLVALYKDGTVRNLVVEENVEYAMEELMLSAGYEPVKYGHPVMSHDAVMPLWDPFHNKVFQP